ncbi:MAG: hypothetical protein IJ150_13665 [Bacteroidales bacterium]|nr:hypothetical protein [Bacteroidales bacterium]
MKKLFLQVFMLILAISGCSNNLERTSGEFSVSETKKVYFSRSNLQYNKKNKTYFFSNSQYKVFTSNNDTTDLFEYKGYENFFNEGCQWRLLTAQEWAFLLFERQNAFNLSTFATINSKKGFLLLPDDFKLSKTLKIKTLAETKTKKVSDKETTLDKKVDLFLTNNFNTSEWEELEKLGAVFLPFSGKKIKNNSPFYDEGAYWIDSEEEHYATFSSQYYSSYCGCCKNVCSFSVRLVVDTK